MATTKKTSASSKSASSIKSTAAKAVPVAFAVDDAESTATLAIAAAAKTPILRIRDFVGQVTEATGGKKKDVREIVEATLIVLGDALARGDDMNLPGLGRTRIARSTERDGASHLTLKVRRGPHKAKTEKEPLADEEDDG